MRFRRRKLDLTAEQQRAVSIAYIRESFAMFGMPLDDLTDEQIEEGVQAFADVSRAAGVTTAEAQEAFAVLGRAMNEAPGLSWEVPRQT